MKITSHILTLGTLLLLTSATPLVPAPEVIASQQKGITLKHTLSSTGVMKMRITGPVKLDDAAVGPEAETGAGGRGGAAAVKFYRHLQSYMAKHGYPIAKYRFIGLWGELEGPEWHGMIGCEIEAKERDTQQKAVAFRARVQEYFKDQEYEFRAVDGGLEGQTPPIRPMPGPDSMTEWKRQEEAWVRRRADSRKTLKDGRCVKAMDMRKYFVNEVWDGSGNDMIECPP